MIYAGMLNPRARQLRTDMTDAERRLWSLLRNRRLDGHKFRRQHPIGSFIADFACVERMLIVEADGGQHSDESDAGRTAWLEREGYRVIRFWNNDILGNLDGVLQMIVEALNQQDPHPSPLPQAGEGDEGPQTVPSPACGRRLG